MLVQFLSPSFSLSLCHPPEKRGEGGRPNFWFGIRQKGGNFDNLTFLVNDWQPRLSPLQNATHSALHSAKTNFPSSSLTHFSHFPRERKRRNGESQKLQKVTTNQATCTLYTHERSSLSPESQQQNFRLISLSAFSAS